MSLFTISPQPDLSFGPVSVTSSLQRDITLTGTPPAPVTQVTVLIRSDSLTRSAFTFSENNVSLGGVDGSGNPIPLTKPIHVTFKPTAVSPPLYDEGYTLTCNIGGTTPVQTSHIRLLGSGVATPGPVSVELVLDRSGSMAGTSQAGVTKMKALGNAVSLFADLVLDDSTRVTNMGAVIFNDQNSPLVAIDRSIKTHQDAIKTQANNISTTGRTSIGGGINLGLDELNNSAQAANTSHVLVVFTDGLENHPPFIATVDPILSSNTVIYAIALGQPQINPGGVFSQIVNKGKPGTGRFFMGDDAWQLPKYFNSILTDVTGAAVVSDPLHTITPGQTIDVPSAITTLDSCVTFVLSWERPTTTLGLTIIAPDDTEITPDTANITSDISYISGETYAFYRIRLPLRLGDSYSDSKPLHSGSWAMRVQGTNIDGEPQSENFTTFVFADSPVHLQTSVNAPNATSPIRITASVDQKNVPIPDAEVSVTVTAPTVSLAQVATEDVLQRARDADDHPDRVDRPLIGREEKTYQMVRDKGRADGNGDFLVELPATGIDGVYSFSFSARGKIGGEREVFERWSAYEGYVGVP